MQQILTQLVLIVIYRQIEFYHAHINFQYFIVDEDHVIHFLFGQPNSLF